MLTLCILTVSNTLVFIVFMILNCKQIVYFYHAEKLRNYFDQRFMKNLNNYSSWYNLI